MLGAHTRIVIEPDNPNEMMTLLSDLGINFEWNITNSKRITLSAFPDEISNTNIAMRKFMPPFLLFFATAIVSIVMAITLYIAVNQNDLAPASRSYGLTIIFCFLTLALTGILLWLFTAYDFVPRDWDSRMRQESRIESMDQSNFVKGGIVGSGYSIPIKGDANILYFPGATQTNASVQSVGLGVRSTSTIAVIGNSQLLGKIDLDKTEIDQLEFVLFTERRIYQYGWRNIKGSFWMRK